MKRPVKLRRYMTVFLLGVTLVMIAAYSLLVEFSLSSGIEDAALYELTFNAHNYAKKYKLNPDTPLPGSKYLTVYTAKTDLPVWFVNRYPSEPILPGKLYSDDWSDPQVNSGEPFFFMAAAYDLHDEKRIYLIEIYTREDEIPGMFEQSKRAGYITLGLGVGFILIIAASIKLLFNRVSDPINDLTKWAQTLDREKLAQPHPGFRFEEVNQLADLIQGAVSDLNQALLREHQFLSHASHELRTPIAVIQSNLDLLERLPDTRSENEDVVYQRIKRAANNMQGLTETLLWLSRKEETMPQAEQIDLKEMVADLIDKNQYLLVGKTVDVKTGLSSSTIRLPRIAIEIVLDNLIRNAFQYTSNGTVNIIVSPDRISIVNQDRSAEQQAEGRDGYGFGLGLMLVEQICDKIELSYRNEPVQDGHKAVIEI